MAFHKLISYYSPLYPGQCLAQGLTHVSCLLIFTKLNSSLILLEKKLENDYLIKI